MRTEEKKGDKSMVVGRMSAVLEKEAGGQTLFVKRRSTAILLLWIKTKNNSSVECVKISKVLLED